MIASAAAAAAAAFLWLEYCGEKKEGAKEWPSHLWSFDCWHAGATQEALVEQYNDQLRELREAGLSEQAEEVREALRALRDEERAPESSVKVRLPFLRFCSLYVCCAATVGHAAFVSQTCTQSTCLNPAVSLTYNFVLAWNCYASFVRSAKAANLF